MKIPVFCQITMLNLISAAVSLNLSPRDLAKYDEKLRLYQNMTGISEQAFNEIWEEGVTNRKFSRIQ